MLVNRFPYHFQDVKKMYKEQTDYPKFIRSRYIDCNTRLARNLLEALFDPTEKYRPTMAEVLQHEWVTSKAARG